MNKDKINKEIKENLDLTISVFTRSVPNLISIILVGGLGRGDANISYNKDTIISSDIDIYVVTKNRLKGREIKRIKRNIKKELIIGPKSKNKPLIDLHFTNLNELKNCLPLLRFYDLKYASKIIYGVDVRERIPNFTLPYYEGTRLLLNRLRYSCEWITLKKISEIEDRKFLTETSKNYYICCQAISILARKYEPFPKKAVNNIDKTINDLFPELKDYDLKIKAKKYFSIRTGANDYKTKNAKKEWLKSIEILLKIIEYYHLKGIQLKSWNKFEKKLSKIHLIPYIKQKTRNPYSMNRLIQKTMVLKYFLKLIKKQTIYPRSLFISEDPALHLYKSTYYITKAIISGKIEPNMLKNAVHSLRRIYPVKKIKCSSDDYDKFLKNLKIAYDNYYSIGKTYKGKRFNVSFTTFH